MKQFERLSPSSPVARRAPAIKIAYFVHDLSDAAVRRRVRMLTAGGAKVVLLGFRRTDDAIDHMEGVTVVDFGRTGDGKLAARALSVAGVLWRIDKVVEELHDADAILARNLEMLVIAARARRRGAPRARLVYECLDIHRLLLSPQPHGALLRRLELSLWQDIDLLLTSSPAFIENYFAPRGIRSPIKLIENKVLQIEGSLSPEVPAKIGTGPPWRIGWFGMLRCRKSLDILGSLARQADGLVEVVIRGRPSGATFTFTEFETAVAKLPHVFFAGPYHSPTDLPAIYREVHFSWAIDYFEEGQNSAWLLPNRIYESALFGAVPIALSDVATGRWLAERKVGVLLEEPVGNGLLDFANRLSNDQYANLARKVRALPRRDLTLGRANCRELVEAVCGR